MAVIIALLNLALKLTELSLKLFIAACGWLVTLVSSAMSGAAANRSQKQRGRKWRKPRR